MNFSDGNRRNGIIREIVKEEDHDRNRTHIADEREREEERELEKDISEIENNADPGTSYIND